MIQKELRHSDPPKQVAATARVPGGGREANRPYSSAPAREAATSAAAAAVAPSSQLWLGIRDPRIVRVSRALGGKDRHSKVSTVRGLRDRRVRLSVQTAIQLYDLQDRLGLSQPSKVVDWLLDAARHEIDKLPPPNFPPNFPQVGNISSWGNIPHDHVSQRNSSTCSTTLSKEDYQHRNDVDAKEGCDGGRGGDRWNSTALVSYRQLGAADDVLPSSSSSTVTAAFQVMPGSYALQPSVRGDDPSYLCYNHRLAVAANPSQMSLLPVLGGITKSQTTSAAPTAVLFCTPGTITMPPSLIQAYATSASAHDSKLLDHFHSVCASTATEGTSPIAAPQSYLPSTNLDSFPAEAVAAAPSLIGRLFP